MSIRRIQGLALFLGAAFLPLGLLDLNADYFRYLGLISVLLFLFGIPAISASQPSGPIGWIGILLIVLAAVIAFGFKAGVFGDTGFEDALIATSVIAALAGRIITGWLTIKKQVFSPWLGIACCGCDQFDRIFGFRIAWHRYFDCTHVVRCRSTGYLRYPDIPKE